MKSNSPILSVQDLSVDFVNDRGQSMRALDRVSFDVEAGRSLCLVGESGCGKSVTAKAILQVLGENARLAEGIMRFARSDGICDLAQLDPKSRMSREIRGEEIAMIYQEPMSALSPLYTIGDQISEVLRWHRGTRKKAARAEAIEMLRKVGMPDPERRFDAYSFELSGGQRQRAVIAMALIAEPRLLIADEPTTALDVTTQAGILALLRQLQEEQGMSMVFITHDLGVVSEIADDVAVMYMGKIVERGPVEQILSDPRHPYTKGLLASLPSVRGARKARLNAIPGAVPQLSQRPSGCAFAARCAYAMVGTCTTEGPDMRSAGDAGHSVACHALDRSGLLPELAEEVTLSGHRRTPDYAQVPVLKVRELCKTFSSGGGFFGKARHVHALNGVSFDLYPGETLGVVGESGCGKSTLGRAVIGLNPATEGTVEIDSKVLGTLTGEERKALWRQIRMVFQDPATSLNPRMTVQDILAEVLRTGGEGRDAISARLEEVMGLVGLDPQMLDRHPHAFSGGQRQRIGIARALAPEPQVIIADEAVSALDVSVQAQVLNLFAELQARLHLSYIFISHDLSVVRHVSDRVAVMYAGEVVEIAPTEELFAHPRHPYTRTLLDAVLEPDATGPKRTVHTGDALAVPDPGNLPVGCKFQARCPRASAHCSQTAPSLGGNLDPAAHSVACHFPLHAVDVLAESRAEAVS